MAGPITKVGVIGAGLMGAGIAAQCANAGIAVRLLDIVPPGASDRGVPPGASDRGVPPGAADRNALAKAALQRLSRDEPAAFMAPEAARRITIGNLEDDLGLLADCDWVIEAVIERLDAKQALYQRLASVLRPGTALSSNTSTIPLALLTEGMAPALLGGFMITHFFNPPRYMRLLELVPGPDADPAIVARVRDFADHRLGKTIITCKDSPGFIANRLGIFWLQLGIVEAIRLGLTVEEADAVFGKPLGIPKTGLFGLMDLVGIDLSPHLNISMRATLPPTDPFQPISADLPLIGRMIASGLTGRKGKGGFYRMQKSESGRTLLAIDLQTGEYRPTIAARSAALADPGRDLHGLLGDGGPIGTYALSVLGQVIAYAARLVPSAAHTIADVDAAMRLGYNWKEGPFELADRIGVAWLVERLRGLGIAVPDLLADAAESGFYRREGATLAARSVTGEFQPIARAEGVVLLEDVKRTSKPLLRRPSAALWDIGDGIACFELCGKANTIDPEALGVLEAALDLVRQQFRGLVLYSDAANFSLGANLGMAMFAANIAAWEEIEKLVASGQRVYGAMQSAPFPVVAAPAGMVLGGGCELVLHADRVVAHAETYIGLVECGVGLVPAWGGCKEMLARWRADPPLPRGPVPAAAKVFELISVATVAKSAMDAKALRFLRAEDQIVMNRDRLLACAKAEALALVDGYQPPPKPGYVLPGPSGRTGFMLAAHGFARRGMATPHDLTVADGLAEILSGGEADILDTLSDSDLLALERRVFMRLFRTTPTLARIEHTLVHGKPLRN